MSLEWISCKGACSGSDPTSDTVRINPALLAAQKENVQPTQNTLAEAQKAEEDKKRVQEGQARQQKEAERLRLEQEQRRKLEEEAVRKREEQLAAEREAVARAAAEREAAEKAAAEAAEAEAAKEREEQRLRLEAERLAQEKQRQEQEVAEAQRREQLQAAQEKVDQWCKANGYPDMNAKKKSFMSGSKFPIHEAVAKKNEEIIALLLQTGVDKTVKNSKGQTAEDLARKLNKAGSMDAIIAQFTQA